MNQNPASRQIRSSPIDVTICGIDELIDYRDAKISHVLSILDPATPEPDAFGSFGEHARLELRFHDVIEDDIPGFDPPHAHHIAALLEFGRGLPHPADGPAHLLVHCHMGISRSTAAATLLLVQAEPRRSPAEIVANVARLRPKAWPNLRMIELGDQMLGLRGNLVQAVRARHREMAQAQPHLATFMRDAGRGRELD